MTRTERDCGNVIDDNPGAIRIPKSVCRGTENGSDQPVPAVLNDRAHFGAGEKGMAGDQLPLKPRYLKARSDPRHQSDAGNRAQDCWGCNIRNSADARVAFFVEHLRVEDIRAMVLRRARTSDVPPYLRTIATEMNVRESPTQKQISETPRVKTPDHVY